MNNVLLASINAGGGHHALRDSFYSVLRNADPGAERLHPVRWDSSDRFVNWCYSFCVNHLTRFQGTVYELSSQAWAVELATRLSPHLLAETQRALKEQPLQAVVSTHFLLSMMFSKAKHSLGMNVPIVNAIPDYGVPTSGFNPQQRHLRPDYLVVMAEDTYRHYLEHERVPASRIHFSGFLTREPFVRVGRARAGARDRSMERARILRALTAAHPQLGRLRPELPTVLFAGGSAWASKTAPVLERLFQSPELLQRLNLVVVSGKGARFHEELLSRASAVPHLAVFGYVPPEDYAQLMGLCDFPVLGSLAPASLQELLEARCGPLLLFHYIPGTEKPHVGHIHRERIGLYEPDPERMVRRIEEAAGLVPPSDHVAPLLSGFTSRAREIRQASEARARELPVFLDRIVAGSIPPRPRERPVAAAVA